ncbi:MAG: monophosphatase [Candidatus Atribacteria bacterium]|nr:monophosphatase [Candidatus Atribacteria bacterium]
MSDRLNLALQVVEEVGEFVKKNQSNITSINEKKSNIDLVTDVDQKSQQLIEERLKKAFPHDLVWGEESGFPLTDFSSTWVIDPIDGTSNFVHQIPLYSISIAYFKDGVPIMGVIGSPNLGEVIWAEDKQGAFLNGKPVSVSSVSQYQRAIFGMGIPHQQPEWETFFPVYSRLPLDCQAVRSLGSAALGVAYVGCGRIEGYLQVGISFYDVAAGVCIVREAGGRVLTWEGKEWDRESRTIVVVNRELEKSLFERYF